MEHGSQKPLEIKEKPVKVQNQPLRIEEIPREPAPTNTDTTLANIASSAGPQKQYDSDIDAVIEDLQMSYRSDDEDSSQRMENARTPRLKNSTPLSP